MASITVFNGILKLAVLSFILEIITVLAFVGSSFSFGKISITSFSSSISADLELESESQLVSGFVSGVDSLDMINSLEIV